MGSIFDDVKLGWNGREVVLRSHRVMGALARVEDVITYGELIQSAGAGKIPVAKLSAAYASILRYAGVDVTDEDVYAGMMRDGMNQAQIMGAVQGLLEIMIPKAERNKAEAKAAKAEASGNSQAAGASSAPAARSKSSRPSTKRSSRRPKPD